MINNQKLEDICLRLQEAYESDNSSNIRRAESAAYSIFVQLAKLQLSKLAFSSDDIRQYVISDSVTRCMIAVKKFKLFLDTQVVGVTDKGDIIGYSKRDKDVKVTYPLSACYFPDHTRINTTNISQVKPGDTILLKNNCFSFFASTILNCASTSIKTYKKCADISLSAFESSNNK